MRNLYRNPAYDLMSDPDPRYFDGPGENGPNPEDGQEVCDGDCEQCEFNDECSHNITGE